MTQPVTPIRAWADYDEWWGDEVQWHDEWDEIGFTPLPESTDEIFIVTGGDMRGTRYFTSRDDADAFAATRIHKPAVTRSRVNVPAAKQLYYVVQILFRAQSHVEVYYQSTHRENPDGKSTKRPCLFVRKRRSELESPRPWVVDFICNVRASSPELAKKKAWDNLRSITEKEKVLPIYSLGHRDSVHAWGTIDQNFVVTFTDAKGIPLDAQVYIASAA